MTPELGAALERAGRYLTSYGARPDETPVEQCPPIGDSYDLTLGDLRQLHQDVRLSNQAPAGERPAPADVRAVHLADLIETYAQPNGVLCVDAAEFTALVGRFAGQGLEPAVRSMLRTPAGGKACLA
jgi:hypothetical protein